MPAKVKICDLNDIPNNGTKGYTIETTSTPLKMLLVRTGTEVYGYSNRCPHTGVNLDWTPDQFLDMTGKLIQCSTHGALFRIHDGYCTHGPCAGNYLTSLDLYIENEEIILMLQL